MNIKESNTEISIEQKYFYNDLQGILNNCGNKYNKLFVELTIFVDD